MKSIRSAIFFALITLLASVGSAFAQSSLAVNNAAAMEGTYGLEVSFNGAPTLDAFVRDTTPNNETVYRCSFLFNANNTAIAFAGRHLIFSAGINSPNGSRSVEIQVRRNPSNTLDLRAYNQVSGTDASRRGTAVIPITDDQNHLITLEWTPASAPGVADGVLRLSVDGVTVENTTIRSSNQNLRAAAIGVLGGSVDAGTTGSHYFDDFQSFRTLAP